MDLSAALIAPTLSGHFLFFICSALPSGGREGGFPSFVSSGRWSGISDPKKTRLAVFCFGERNQAKHLAFCSRSVNIEPRSKFGTESAQNGKCESDRPKEATPRVRWTRKFSGYLSDYGIANGRFCGSVFRLIAACKASGKQPKTRPKRDGSGRREKTKSRATPDFLSRFTTASVHNVGAAVGVRGAKERSAKRRYASFEIFRRYAKILRSFAFRVAMRLRHSSYT